MVDYDIPTGQLFDFEASDIGDGPSYAGDRGQLNASMSYRIDNVFSLTLSGVNLTKESVRIWCYLNMVQLHSERC